jgi:aminoglycoside phosphotransferase (APT) family kinase protein
MPGPKMHVDEIDIDDGVVQRLIDTQFPHWSGLAIRRVDSDGTENAIFRFGDDMAARLPRHPRATGALDKEYAWLPRLAPLLPLPVTIPLARGVPGEGFPFSWLVTSWIDGERATQDRVVDPSRLAIDLAGFIQALREIDPTGAPTPSAENYGRGTALERRDSQVRRAIAELGDTIDADAATAAWERALDAPVWSEPPVWIHGDLQSGNLLVRDGRLCGVIDFGALAVGDPACELSVAWMMFDPEARPVFRDALSVDDANWARGAGWALSIALIYVPYYTASNPEGAARARRVIDAVLADHAPDA